MLRAFVEWASRGVVLKRRLPAEFGGGTLLVSPDASLRYWRRNLWKVDPMLLNAVRLLVQPGNVVWDIGANVGLFSFAARGLAGQAGKVFTVEPDPWLADLLRRSARLQEKSDASIDVLSVAIGERLGIAALNIAKRGRATNFIAGCEPSSQTGGIREAVLVPTVTLDWLLESWPAPSVVKIDVEGAEAAVFRGAVKLLADIRPRILCEVSVANRVAVTAILKSAGYTLYDAEGAGPASKPLEQCAWNTIAFPTEKDNVQPENKEMATEA